MNTEDPSWDAWKLRRDDLEKGRVPGPFNPQRYEFGMDWMGIPTFFKQPIALTAADLRAGNVDVAMIGAYTDMGSGARGASQGPMPFRACCVYGGWGAVDAPHIGTGIDPFKILNVVGFELVELAPNMDPGYTTIMNSNRLVRECLSGMALRKKGIAQKNHYDPIYIDHGQD